MALDDFPEHHYGVWTLHDGTTAVVCTTTDVVAVHADFWSAWEERVGRNRALREGRPWDGAGTEPGGYPAPTGQGRLL